MKRLTKENLLERVTVNESGCWIWNRAVKSVSKSSSLAYGWITYKGRQMNAHRAAWIVTRGDIPDGLVVCHKCDVPLCVNPEHLFLGSQQDNIKDMWNKGRHPLPSEGVIGSLSSKIDLEAVKNIRNLLASGQKQKEIAKKFGITQSAVSRINTGSNWGRYA